MLRSLAAAALAAVAAADCWDENKVGARTKKPRPLPRARAAAAFARALRRAGPLGGRRASPGPRGASGVCAVGTRGTGRPPASVSPHAALPRPRPSPGAAQCIFHQYKVRSPTRALAQALARWPAPPGIYNLPPSVCLLLLRPRPRSHARPQDGTNTILYSWDLRSLCNNGNGYSFTNGSTLYRFEICGSLDPKVPNLPAFVGDGTTQGQVTGSAQTNTYCNPEYNAYPNVGNFLQFFDPNPQTSASCRPPSVLGRRRTAIAARVCGRARPRPPGGSRLTPVLAGAGRGPWLLMRTHPQSRALLSSR